jgi:rhodanese-related sulfurtransferase
VLAVSAAGAHYAGAVTDGSRTTVEQLLAEARALVHGLSPQETEAAVQAGGLLIDIRPEGLRRRDGVVPGALVIDRNVLEWRCDPASPWRAPEVTKPPGRQLIVMCDEGYQSSLAAAVLKGFGFDDAADVIGGFQAWRASGLSVQPGP